MTLLMERPQELEDPIAIGNLFDSLELPPGFKAELIEGALVVTPPPNGQHEYFFAKTIRPFVAHGWWVSGNVGLATPGGRFIPDLTVAREEFFAMHPDDVWRKPEGVELVAEITSSDADKDRGAKRRGYAAAGIPLYLLIDRQSKEITLFSRPQRGNYCGTLTLPIDEPMPLPEPFSFTLENLV